MQNTESELQLFGFTAMQQSLERRFAIEKTFDDVLISLIMKASKSESTLNYLYSQKASVLNTILFSIDDDLNYLDRLDQECFTVPVHVLLEQEFAFARSCNEQHSEEALDDAISKLSQLYIENCVFTTMMEEEDVRFKLIKPLIDDQINCHTLLEHCLSQFHLTSSGDIQVKLRDIFAKKIID